MAGVHNRLSRSTYIHSRLATMSILQVPVKLVVAFLFYATFRFPVLPLFIVVVETGSQSLVTPRIHLSGFTSSFIEAVFITIGYLGTCESGGDDSWLHLLFQLVVPLVDCRFGDAIGVHQQLVGISWFDAINECLREIRREPQLLLLLDTYSFHTPVMPSKSYIKTRQLV